MRNTMKKCYRMVAAVLCAAIVLSLPVNVQAAGKKAGAVNYDNFHLVFDVEYYYETNADLQEEFGRDEEALFAHFVQTGIFEGRSGNGEFVLRDYMKYNQDLLELFGTDYGAYCRHLVEQGKEEGRTAVSEEESGELGSYVSAYDPEQQRATNVEVAASRINDIVLQPGEKFSFNKTVLPRTRANGYVPGPVIKGGRLVDGMGGGICQVSSTLYVAMVLAGIPATEHYNHSLPVEYAPRGLDATISGNSKDLKFVNTFSFPIVIKAEAVDGVLTVTLEEYVEENEEESTAKEL
ncbi:MAG: VanW family protein [Lachnospiraceae bacterium]|nr:VanW family protein [Lachnospiraceae bacterium]